MATKKTTTKKATKSQAARSGSSKAATKQASSTPAKAKRKKTYTAARLRHLLDTMLGRFEEQISEQGLKFSPGDGLRMMQLREGEAAEHPSEVTVEWVETKKQW